jgi:hypothetical protein
MDQESRRSFVKKSLATSVSISFVGLIRAHGEEGGGGTTATTTTTTTTTITTITTTMAYDSGSCQRGCGGSNGKGVDNGCTYYGDGKHRHTERAEQENYVWYACKCGGSLGPTYQSVGT